MSYSIKAIDCVVNPITPEILRLRPSWFNDFYSKKIGRDKSVSEGLSHEGLGLERDGKRPVSWSGRPSALISR